MNDLEKSTMEIKKPEQPKEQDKAKQKEMLAKIIKEIQPTISQQTEAKCLLTFLKSLKDKRTTKQSIIKEYEKKYWKIMGMDENENDKS